ncbi:unnamed protein product [Lupinus luteus]|uniref:F-box domain-containing protein n=1 Tax=Lupinus luteus TaxID=3873 RepID=A0AAV1W141_LUPLU
MNQGSSNKFDTLERSSDIEDRISELPNEIICYIFTFLNLKEIIKTKVLSHEWNERSIDMSNLVFDPTLINIDLVDDASLESIPLPQKYQFIEQVDQLLEIFNINQSASFTIWFPMGKQFTSHIDKWVNRAIIKECEKLDLELKFARIDDEPYNFPFHILLSSKKSHLKWLSLCECQVKPTREVVHRLNLLESLTLVYVSMEASDLEIILSSCLNLEFLHLIDCEVLTLLRIFNQDIMLKRLFVTPLIFVANIELSIPSLELFTFSGEIENFTISRMSQLKTVELSIEGTYPRGMGQLLDELSRNAPLLQTLFLSSHFDEFLSHAHNNNQTPKFNNLTHLELIAKGEYGWNVFIGILYKSPKLEVVVIEGYTPPIDDEPSWTNQQLVPTCISSSLKIVRFDEFKGQDFEVEMIEYIRFKRLFVTLVVFVANIELSIPSLELFTFDGVIENFTFSRMNQLKTVELYIEGTYPRVLFFMQFLSHAHNNNETPKFNNLTHLKLTPKGDYGWNVFIGILYKSPKLEVLVIEARSVSTRPTQIQHGQSCLSKCLAEELDRLAKVLSQENLDFKQTRDVVHDLTPTSPQQAFQSSSP